MNDLDLFEQHRDRLFGIAYRMVGTVADAEDLVQEAYLRWHAATAEVQNPGAYLTTIITRLCLDHLKSARVRREEYVGPWLPEPLAPGRADHPAELADALSMALLLVLETLTPTERAVFLLREVFGYDYAEIAPMVGQSAVYCRKIAQRAREHVAAERSRFEPSADEHARLVDRFLAACRDGDMEGLLDVLADDVTLTTDGGGKVLAALRPIVTSDKVARFMLGILRKAPSDLRVERATINGRPGFIAFRGAAVDGAWAFEVGDGRIRRIYVVRNPDKLRHLAS
ncbi:MAG: RNA polymerase sigma-70 factor [Bacteroidetes bacterium]|jgi:RNA polymerase sigma-70 factor (ECF subfamily)|nr:RNA polymerase sigma-70 factor [Bacteroidota bacterium]